MTKYLLLLAGCFFLGVGAARPTGVALAFGAILIVAAAWAETVEREGRR